MLLTFLICLRLAGIAIAEDRSATPRMGPRLVIVGGGMGGRKVETELLTRLLELSPAERPKVLVIPYASASNKREASGQTTARKFHALGVEKVEVLNLDSPEEALKSIENCDAVWISGGSQARLMRALNEQETCLKALRERGASGIPIGGSSAGAAVMSEVMIANSNRDPRTKRLVPVMSAGLGFLPGVIIDQHFSQRNRLERLEQAIEDHPKQTGIGIDERTAIIFDSTTERFTVAGEGTVTVVRYAAEDASTLNIIPLESGSSFTLSEGNTK